MGLSDKATLSLFPDNSHTYNSVCVCLSSKVELGFGKEVYNFANPSTNTTLIFYKKYILLWNTC